MSESLSPAEFNTLIRTFHQFDADNSNSIDVSELSVVMEHLGVSMAADQLGELVEQVDKNRNGELEFEEFCQLICMWKDASKFRLFDGKGVKSLATKRIEEALHTKLLVPDSPLRCAYDTLIALAAAVYFALVLWMDAWEQDVGGNKEEAPGAAWFDAIAIIVTVLFTIDIPISCMTCRVEGYSLVDTPQEAVLAYAKSWLIPDLLAALPWEFMGGSLAFVVLRHLRLLKLAKIPFLWQHSGRVPVNAQYISFHFKILPICLILLQFVLVVHGFAMGFVIIKEYGANAEEVDCNTKRYPYEKALYFVIYTVCTVGYGDIPVRTTEEKWYVCFVLFGTLLTNGFIIGKLVSIMQKADIHQDRRAKLRETLAVLQHFQLPGQLQDEVLQFQDHLLGHSLSASYASIVEGLPDEMQSNISLFVKLKLIRKAPQFENSHYIVKVAIAETLANYVILPEQYVVVAGEDVDTMYFIAHGFADVFNQERQHLQTLKSGDHFNESALLHVAPSTKSVKALAYSDLWGLHRTEFLPLLGRFPRFRRTIHDMAEEQGIRIEEPKDVKKQQEFAFGEPEFGSSRRSTIASQRRASEFGKSEDSASTIEYDGKRQSTDTVAPSQSVGPSRRRSSISSNNRKRLSVDVSKEGLAPSPGGGMGQIKSTAPMAKGTKSEEVSRRKVGLAGNENQLTNILQRLETCTRRIKIIQQQTRGEIPMSFQPSGAFGE